MTHLLHHDSLTAAVILRTLLTRDMTANMAASAITVVSMPALERLVAILCPCKEVKMCSFSSKNMQSFSWRVLNMSDLPGRREHTPPR